MSGEAPGEQVGLPMDNEEQVPLGCRALMSVFNRFYGSF